jgi:stearoyl-CoA desaturase (delta-9 desaturase)
MGWLLIGEAKHNNTQLMAKYAPDLAKHRFYVWLNNYAGSPWLCSPWRCSCWEGFPCSYGAFAFAW